MEGSEQRAIRRLCRDLGLPAGDAYTQDWAYELPEEYRTTEAFYKYLAAYSIPEYGDDERLLLAQLMLDVVNDLYQQNSKVGRSAWEQLVERLRSRPELHRDQVEYWASLGDPLEDAFAITPLARALWEEEYTPQQKN